MDVFSPEARQKLFLEHQEEGRVSYGLRYVKLSGMLPDIRQVETTSICNLTCVFCPYEKLTREKQNMDVQSFWKFLAEQAPHVRTLGLHHFGEPFLNRDLPKFIKVCSALGIESSLSTNGTRISRDRAAEVIKSRLTRIVFSLDGATASTYEALRRGAKFENVISNINIFLEEKIRAAGGTYVQIKMINTLESRDEWERFREQWENTPGVDQVLRRDELTHAGSSSRSDRITKREPRHPCRFLWQSVVVLADGRVVPCCADFDGKEVLGNVFQGDKLADIWNGKRMQELRRMHADHEFQKIPLCSNCNDWTGNEPMTASESRESFNVQQSNLERLSRQKCVVKTTC